MQLEHPDWVRRVNYFGPAVGGAHHVVPIDADDLLAEARATTGLHEIGDEQWHETYRRSVASMVGDRELHLVGRLVTRAELLRVLTTRLRLHEYWRQHPAVIDEPVEAPVFILGPPRTGTTILFELLAHDPGMRAPISWETNHPFATPERGMELAESEHQLWSDVHPPFQAMHELAPHLPAECVHFLAMDFGGPYWGMMYARPTFDEWAATQDLATPVYTFHRRFLQTLQHRDGLDGRPRRPWLLKSPGHSGTITALLAEYPDARFVHTHRDPTKFAASAGNLMCALRFMRTDDVSPLEMGPGSALVFAYLAQRIIDLRADGTIPEDRIADIHFLDLMADPVATVQAAYEHLGLAWSAGHGEAITRYLADKPKGKFGAHRYDPADLGLSNDLIRQHYQAYVDHYGVVSET